MSVKTTQEAGEIWYHREEDSHYVLIEHIDKYLWNQKSYTHQWNAFCITTGSLGLVCFNSGAPDYDVWNHLA